MKLVLAVVQDSEAGRVVDALVQRDFRATRINTAGGFLKRGNATILTGVRDEQVDDVVAIVREHCHPARVPDEGALAPGVIFVLPVAGSYRM